MQKTQVHLSVRDPARSAVFYEALLGAAPAHRTKAAVVFDLESPPLHLTVEEAAHARKARYEKGAEAERERQLAGPVSPSHAQFTLVVSEPREVGSAAVALRRAGVRLRLEDRGIAAEDPDDNGWRVKFVPTARGRSVVA